MTNEDTRHPLPTVHLNGTGREELTEQARAVLAALAVLDERMAAATPNARDYYPQGPGAFGAAVRAADARRAALNDIRTYYAALYVHLAEQA